MGATSSATCVICDAGKIANRSASASCRLWCVCRSVSQPYTTRSHCAHHKRTKPLNPTAAGTLLLAPATPAPILQTWGRTRPSTTRTTTVLRALMASSARTTAPNATAATQVSTCTTASRASTAMRASTRQLRSRMRASIATLESMQVRTDRVRAASATRVASRRGSPRVRVQAGATSG